MLPRSDLEQFHLLLGGNPFDLKLQVDHPVSDMHVAGEALGMIDFASLQEVMPLEDVTLGGRLEADLRWDTRMSYIEQEQFEQVDLDGNSSDRRIFWWKHPIFRYRWNCRKWRWYFNPGLWSWSPWI